ncbi:brachyurin-like, partial [Asbolus verrucosus]
KTPAQLRRNMNGRIIGGDPARAGQFPFAAAIYTTTEHGRYFCGGALISNEWILTSGHCVENVLQFRILLGSITLTSPDFNRVTVTANSSVLHPDYDNLTLQNDIGLIHLSQPVLFSDYISTIFLPAADLQPDAAVVSIGWGQTDDYHPGPVEHLNDVDVVTLSDENCKKAYGNQIGDNMICVQGSYNQGTCLGDSGTPLVRYILNERHAEHVGISSFISENGCESTDPSGYTKTYGYLEWIKSVTNIP